MLSFPLCVPGTAFYQCMQGRKKIMNMLKQQLGERRKAAEREAVDFFDIVIDEMDRPGSGMSESIALDLLFLMLFASHETTSIGLTAILKFLTDSPKALQELAEEHESIQRRRADPDSEITWEEYKSMEFTSHVLMGISFVGSQPCQNTTSCALIICFLHHVFRSYTKLLGWQISLR